MLIDLQFHSTYSDGYSTPTRLAKFMQKRGVKVASLTDHNTVGGQAEFKRACQKRGIKAIPAIEIYTKLENKKFNIIWYNYQDHRHLHEMLRKSQIRRRNNVRRMLKKLNDLGFKIEIEKLLDKYTHYVPINHIVDEITAVEHNCKKIKKDLDVKDFRSNQVIENYFYNSHIGKLRESYIDIHRILELREEIGGEIVLNHPGKHSHQLKSNFIEKLKDLGLDGIEVLSPHHSLGEIMYLQYMCRRLDFLETGGSDYHLSEGGNYPIQNSWDYFKIDSDHLRGVEKIIG